MAREAWSVVIGDLDIGPVREKVELPLEPSHLGEGLGHRGRDLIFVGR